MRIVQSFLKRARSLFTKEASDLALREELEFHLDQAIAENLAQGMPEQEARRAAQQSFGSLAEATSDCYEARGTAWLADLGNDISFGFRVFSKHRSFTVLTVLTLALGI